MLIVGLVIMQIVAFGIVIYVLKKMMVGDTESAVNRLNQSYEEMGKKKEELATKIQQIEQEYLKKKDEAEKIAIQIKEAAEKEMYDKADALIKKAKAEAERVITEANGTTARMREELHLEERVKVVDYCDSVLKQALSEVVRDNITTMLVDNFVNELSKMDMSHVPTNINDVEVVVCKPLAEETKKKILNHLQTTIGRSFTMKETLDEHIIGGVILKFGTLEIDGSIAAKIRDIVTGKKQRIENRLE